MGLALGAEYRKEKRTANRRHIPTSTISLAWAIPLRKVPGNVKALYAELAAPVMKELELQFALRSDDYSDYGRSTTPKDPPLFHAILFPRSKPSKKDRIELAKNRNNVRGNLSAMISATGLDTH